MEIKPYSADIMFNVVTVKHTRHSKQQKIKTYAFLFEANWEKSFRDNCNPVSVIITSKYQNQPLVAVLVWARLHSGLLCTYCCLIFIWWNFVKIISVHVPSKVWEEIYIHSKLQALEIWERISNFIPHFTGLWLMLFHIGNSPTSTPTTNRKKNVP